MHTDARMGARTRARHGWQAWARAPLALAAWALLSAAATQAQAIAEQLAACKAEGAVVEARISACSKVIEGAKDDEEIRAEAHLQRGVLHELAGNREAAISDYSEIIKLDPTNAVAYFNRGNAYDQLGEHDLAIADYTEAIKLDPTDPDAFNNRGQAYDNKGEYDLAIADYTESIRLAKDNPRAFFNRGLALAIQGEPERAVADFSQAIKLEPGDAEAYVNRGAAYEELGN